MKRPGASFLQRFFARPARARLGAAASALALLTSCGQNPQGSDSLGEISKQQPADNPPLGRQASGLITLTLPSPAELCAKRYDTADAMIAYRAQQILEFCNENSPGDCAQRDQCYKGLLARVAPGELKMSLTVSPSSVLGSLNQDRTRKFLIESTTRSDTDSFQRGLTVFFGFTWTFNPPGKNGVTVRCVPPMETNRGQIFARTLLNQLASVTYQDEKDPCRLTTSGQEP